MICFLVMQIDLAVKSRGPSFPAHACAGSGQEKVGDRLPWSKH